MNPELALPMLAAATLLLLAGSPSFQVITNGVHTVDDGTNGAITAGGTTSVAMLNGSLYLIDGNVSISGVVRGDIVQLGGQLILEERASVSGTVTQYAGSLINDAKVTVIESGEIVPESGFGLRLLIGAIVCGLVIAWLRPTWPERVAGTLRAYPGISATIGAVTLTVSLVLVVLMAFTVVLIPVSVLAVLFGMLLVTYSLVCFGQLLGDYINSFGGLGSLASLLLGITLIWLVTRMLELVSATSWLVLVLHVTGVGAILLSYGGAREFSPVTRR